MADKWDKVIAIVQLFVSIVTLFTLVTVVVVLTTNVTVTLPGGVTVSPGPASGRSVVSTVTSTLTVVTSPAPAAGIHQISTTFNSGNSFFYAYVQNYTQLIITYTNGQAGSGGTILFGPTSSDPAYPAGGCIDSTSSSTPCNVASNYQGTVQLPVQGAYIFFPGYSGNPPILYGS